MPLPPEPSPYISKDVVLSKPPLTLLRSLKATHPTLASIHYPEQPSNAPNSEARMFNTARVVHARYLHFPHALRTTITGRNIETSRMREINDKLKKWDEQMLRDQVQSRSFQFRYAKGLYLWHDIRVWLLDFYHDYQRCLVVPERELEHQRDERRSLASRYHLAIRQSYNNIDDQVRAIITTQHTEIAKENNGEKRARKEDVLEEYEHQRQQLIAILPADWERANPAFNNDLDAIPQEGQLYCDLTPDQREAFWNATWNENVFVSWLWTYQSVLDFQKCWDDLAVRNMFHFRYMQLCQNFVIYIWANEVTREHLKVLSPNVNVRVATDLQPLFAQCYKIAPTLAEYDGFGGYGQLWTTHDSEKRNRTGLKGKKKAN